MSIADFKRRIKGGGVRANLFEVEFSFPAYAGGGEESDQGRYLVRSTQLPSSVLGVIEVPYQGRVLPLAGDRTFEEWTCTILMDTDFGLRDAMERWSNGINGLNSNTGITNPEDYMVDIAVHQLDRNKNRIKTYYLQDAWPFNVGPVEESMESTDTIGTFDVNFRYVEWSSNTTS